MIVVATPLVIPSEACCGRATCDHRGGWLWQFERGGCSSLLARHSDREIRPTATLGQSGSESRLDPDSTAV
jgi:hypothetical protein